MDAHTSHSAPRLPVRWRLHSQAYILDWKEKPVRAFHMPKVSLTAVEGYMWRWLVLHSDEMAVALFVWLCTLPLIAMLILPRYGLGFTSLVAVAVLFVLMIACWGMCGRKLVKG